MPQPTGSVRRFLPGRRAALVLLGLAAVTLAGIWAIQRRGASEVLDHPVIGVLEEAGWAVDHERRFHAGFLGQTFMGGMIQHPLQREIHFVAPEERVGVLQVEVERRLFGEAGLPEPIRAHGLEWTRQVHGTSAITFRGEPPEGTDTRLEFLRIQVGSGAVHIRTFGH